ncbi:feruloyl esterase [Lophiotrema nucula]|uniref:Carboxylic ester hydrolase n=1 Tax=Lophiotrema nucula TaxID=690887 RepID=A0A6A5YXE3_9PLEO|nr:feruloyl esterase [Lophiotrema nucula]
MAHTGPSPVLSCSAALIPRPTVFGASILSLTASLVKDYTAQSPPFMNPNHGTIPPVILDFCNITIHHTHPGTNDDVVSQIWLPTSNGSFNGRLQGVGGGGFIAGLYDYMFIEMDAAIAEGYAAVSSNAGIYTTDVNGGDADQWALLSPGNVNYNALRNFASQSLYDMTILAKDIIKSYYGEALKYSYFSGCSNGGRQGYVLAQRFPELYDGIAACAPAIFWNEVLVEGHWAQQFMTERNEFPRPCELDYLHLAAIAACDELDGVKDGILQNPDSCTFVASSVLDQSIVCPEAGNKTVKISQTAVDIAHATWTGYLPQYAEVEFQTPTGGFDVDLKFLAGTNCSNGTCVGVASPFVPNWMRLFVAKDKDWKPGNLTRQDFEKMRMFSSREYQSVIGILDYDLGGFKERGGKLITYHGTSDPAVPYKSTLRFYQGVQAHDASVADYYRVFLAPGLGHAIGGLGAYPNTTFHALVDWVEKGIAPDSLQATSQPDANNKTINRVLCAWPKQANFTGGNANEFTSWTCV